MPPTLADRVAHILEAIDQINRALAGKTQAAFSADLLLRLAVDGCGEKRSVVAAIPWKRVNGPGLRALIQINARRGRGARYFPKFPKDLQEKAPMLKQALMSAALVLAVQGTASAQAQEKVVGATEFLNSCASCHGGDGRGDGPVAPYLTVKPPDLTRLSERNKGEFPFVRVFMIIDGRAVVRAHGTETMPVFGDRYRVQADPQGANPFGAEQIARGRVLELVSYLESIQVGAGKDRLTR